jgi:DNA-binding XRE family transcriptional regulator
LFFFRLLVPKKGVPLPKISKRKKIEMKFTERIEQLCEECRMPQRQFAIDLEIDTATCCKIEKGERRVKAEQVAVIACFHCK